VVEVIHDAALIQHHEVRRAAAEELRSLAVDAAELDYGAVAEEHLPRLRVVVGLELGRAVSQDVLGRLFDDVCGVLRPGREVEDSGAGLLERRLNRDGGKGEAFAPAAGAAEEVPASLGGLEGSVERALRRLEQVLELAATPGFPEG
jgi:hypothetical protein